MQVEYRLYYDETGKALFYTCEKPEGNFIVVDAQAYAECRLDVQVKDGVMSRINKVHTLSRLVKDINGTKCATHDVTLIVDDNFDGETKNWYYKNVENY